LEKNPGDWLRDKKRGTSTKRGRSHGGVGKQKNGESDETRGGFGGGAY